MLRESIRLFLGHVVSGAIVFVLGFAGGLWTIYTFVESSLPKNLQVTGPPAWLSFLIFAVALIYGYVNAFRAFHRLRISSAATLPPNPLARLNGVYDELAILYSVTGNTATWDTDPTYYRDRCIRAIKDAEAAIRDDWGAYVPDLRAIQQEPGSPFPDHETALFRRTLDEVRRLVDRIIRAQR